MKHDSIVTVDANTPLIKHKFRTRLPQEVLFCALITVTFSATFVIAFVGYQLGLILSVSNAIDLSNGAQLSISIGVIYSVFFFSFGKYSTLIEDISTSIRRSLLAWVASFVLLILSVFLLKESSAYSRAAVICCFALGSISLPLLQLGLGWLMKRLIERGQIWFQQVALVGLTDIEELMKLQAELAKRGILVAHNAMISLAPSDRSRYLTRCREVALEIQSTLEQHRLDGVWIVAPINEQRRLDELWVAFSQFPLPVILFPNQAVQRTLRLDQVKAGPYNGFEVQRAPLTRSERAIKRMMDIAVALVALVALSPIFLFTSIAILVETGRPILFRQDRKGFGGRPFKILKFRSMRVQENGAEIRQAESKDPRVTPLGAVLRRTSIDELPQLINVLKGEMSIVGPRPHAIAHDNFYDRIIATYAFRHHVKPGITGWAQVNGFRGNTSQLSLMEGRVEHDLWYINHWTPWLDIRIIIKTAIEVFWHDEAY